MSSIDERIVEMRFNNSQFESGVKTTQKSLDDLKKGLDLSGSSKGLEELQAAGSRLNLSTIADGVSGIASKFTSLGLIGVGALVSIGSKAVQVGSQLVSSLTIDPIKSGLDEYNTNLKSVQTILANTQASGAGLDDVNGALNELNKYSDQTIYNFSEMARNIGTFTAAGVGLKPATAAIKGIANLAALSGSNSEQASGAMYQLSQAIASGKVGLQDWNSVVNAGMGGTVFQRALAQTAVAMGKIQDSAVKLDGPMKNVKVNGQSFRDSISAKPGQSSWLTSDVLTKTLSTFTGDLSDAQLAAIGFTKSQVKAVQAQAKSAQQAATVVKTLPDLINTLQESAGSGWTQTWQYVFGDFDQAKELFTGVNNVLSKMIGNSADARNKVLADFEKGGGRDLAIDAIANAFKALMAVLKPIREAFNEIFPPATGAQLILIARAVSDFADTLKVSGSTANSIKRTFAGVFAVLDIGRMIIFEVIKTIVSLFSQVSGGAGSFLDVTANIGDFLVKLRDAIKEGSGLTTFFQGLRAVLALPLALIGAIGSALADLFSGKAIGGNGNAVGKALDGIKERLNPLSGAIDFLSLVWSNFGKAIAKYFEFAQPALEAIGSAFGNLGSSIVDALGSANYDKALDGLNTGLFAALVILIKKFLSNGLNFNVNVGSGGLFGSIKETFEGLTGTLTAMQQNLKANVLLKIAGALAILTASVVALSLIDSNKLLGATAAMSGMFVQLGLAMALFSKISVGPGILKMESLTASMILLAIAIDLLAIAVVKLSKLDVGELARGLSAVSVLLAAMAGTAKLLQGSGPGLITAGLGMIALAAAVNILATAVGTFAAMDLGAMIQGLTGVATTLAIVAGFSKIMGDPKGMITTGLGLILLGAALKIFASAVGDFASIGIENLAVGLTGMAVALAIVAGAMRLMPPSMLASAAALVIVAAALQLMAGALQSLGGMSLDEIGKALGTMAAGLIILAGSLILMEGSLPGAAGLIVAAAALVILADAMQAMGSLSLDEIGKALGLMAASLIILAGSLILMEASLPGAAALLVASAALVILAAAMQTLGGIPIEQIGVALLAMVGAFTVLGVAGALLTPIIPSLLGLGAAILLIGVGVGVAGAGIGLLALGLTALGAAGAAGAAGITIAFGAILGLIPLALTKLGEGIVALAGVIEKGAPAIVNALVAVLLSLIQAIVKVIPAVVSAIVKLVKSLVNAMIVLIPLLVDAGLKIITGVYRGIANNIGKIIKAAADIIVAFLGGIGKALPRIVDAGVKLIINFVNGLATAIRQNTDAMNAAGKNLAGAIIDGMTSGIRGGLGSVVQAATGIGGAALEAVKNILGIHSPSKEFEKLGEFTAEGFAQGLTSGVNDDVVKAYDSMKDMLASAIENTTKSMDDYRDKIDSLTESQKENAKSITDAQDALKKAQQEQDEGKAIKDAQDKLDDLTRARRKDIKAVEDAQAALKKAQKDELKRVVVYDAAEKLADEHEKQRDDARAVRDAQRELRDAKGKDLRKAKQNVSDAEDDLREAQNKKTKNASEQREKANAIRDAKERVAEAKENLKDAKGRNIQDAEENLSDARETLSDDAKSVQDAQDAFNQAKKDEKDHTVVNDAKDKLEELVRTRDDNKEAIEEAQEALAKAVADNKEGKDVNDAKDKLDKLVKARDENTKSLAEAQDGLAQATLENTEASAAYAALTNQLQEQQKALEDLSTAYKQTDDDLKDAEKSLDDATKARDDYNKSIKDQYSELNSIDEKTLLPDYFKNTQEQIAKLQRFTSSLQELRRRGINDAVYSKLLGEGVTALPFVDQLLQRGGQGVQDLNDLTVQLGDAAQGLGNQASTQLYQAGVDSAAGLVQGLKNQKDAIQAQMNEIGASMVEAIKQQLGIHSPSREFAKVGGWSMDGLAQGLKDSSKSVENATAGVGENALSTLKNTMSGIASAIELDMDMTPSIRPVLDLSSVRKDATLIGGMLTPPVLNVDGTYSQAATALAGYDENQKQMLGAKDEVATSTGGDVIFNQYNNSPKALSPAEIYRQTSNQISTVKGALNKK